MPGTVEWLPDAEGTVTDLPVFGSESPMRKVTETVAFDDAWDTERRDKVQALFDGMAADWSGGHGSPERSAPIIDALDRAAMPGGRVVDQSLLEALPYVVAGVETVEHLAQERRGRVLQIGEQAGQP